jgi:hypothetical protein
MILLLLAYRVMIGPFGFLKLVVSLAKFLVAGLGLWWVLQFYAQIHELMGFGRFGLLLSVFVTIGLGGAVYAGLAWLFRCDELTQTVGTVAGKLKRKVFDKLMSRWKGSSR